ncbi:MAG: hypothetical protein KA780_02235 [Prolixibacteraceae bacterium]|jgi:carbon monoxide dehydrogenase subunit G|nr:hypothetical protein [Prolixibacteraceae bacterium]NLX27721.1 hypothetical protein [Bacteroidales bacterium]HOY50840.1 hypothetical protein [Prolixibacteraceae bacterium]HPJ78570.1 hypothetical protein [Prolixibacteraceae bacterium]HRV89674.1 hypothetical protein [Prolixibacteraceae bacterium]
MSVSKYVSEIKYIDHGIETVFQTLSDFRNLSHYINDDILAAVTEKIPQVTISNFESDADFCRFEIGGMGKSEIRIVERTPFSTIKVTGGGGLPLELTFWIQLLPVEPLRTKMRLTLHASMGMMVKMLAGDKLEKGLDQLADSLARLPYR